MTAPPWMPLYTGDYLRDTAHLSTIEHGAYCLLLMHAWNREGLLPFNEDRLRLLTGMSKRDWNVSKDTLLGFFNRTEDGYRQRRVDHELCKVQTLTSKKSDAGKKSAEKRKAQQNQREQSNTATNTPATEPSTDAQQTGNHSHSHSDKKESKRPLTQDRHGARDASTRIVKHPVPRISDPKEAWYPLADRNPDGSPMLTGDDYSPELKARAVSLGKALPPFPPDEANCAMVAGYDLQNVCDRVCDAAKINPENFRGDWTPPINWLSAGIKPNEICQAIAEVASRPGYKPPRFLSYFDKAVRGEP